MSAVGVSAAHGTARMGIAAAGLGLGLIALSAAVADAGAGGVEVQLLTESKRVVPLFHSYKAFTLTDVKPPEVVVVNRSAVAVELHGLILIGLSAGSEVQRQSVDGPTLAERVGRWGSQNAGWLESAARSDAMRVAFGDYRRLDDVAASARLLPGQSAVLFLSRLLHLQHVGPHRLDAIEIAVGYRADAAGADQSARLRVPLFNWEARTDYLFPLALNGLLVTNLPGNLTRHRAEHSSEFAIDVIALRQALDGRLHPARATPPLLADYFVYRQDVLAVADGVVVALGDRYPASSVLSPVSYSEELFARVSAPLIGAIGYANTIAGNFVVIDHGQGVYALYAHLDVGSIRKQRGDPVRRGEVIARVGNTGHSTQPHLHFQLMDGPNFLRANGLPALFENVPLQSMNENFTSANSLYSTDGLFLPPALQ